MRLSCCVLLAAALLACQQPPAAPTPVAPPARTITRLQLTATPPFVFTGGSAVTLRAHLDPPSAGVPILFGPTGETVLTDVTGRAESTVPAPSAFEAMASTPGFPPQFLAVPMDHPFRVTISNDTSGFLGDQVLYLPLPLPSQVTFRRPQWIGTALIVPRSPGLVPSRIQVSCGGAPPATSAPYTRDGIVGSFPVTCLYGEAGSYEIRVEAVASTGHVDHGSARVRVDP